jgi:class 3 adenylate cyclase
VAGRGVSLASRVVDAATPGEVWVTRTVTDLVAGCGLTFEPRGDHTLKGFPDPVTLLAAVDA